MMRQYRRVKVGLPPGVILFFRLGDFYEMFFEDAVEAAPILEIALTRRNGVPMCGVPYHAVEGYLAKMIRRGKKVAICEQVEDPALARGIVRREITRIVTPGTATEDTILEARRNNFLAGVYMSASGFGLAVLDLSTGFFQAERHSAPALVADSLRRYGAAECVLPESQADLEPIRAALGTAGPLTASRAADWSFEYETARDALLRQFGVQTLDGFGCEGDPAVIPAAGGVLYYVKDELRHSTKHIKSLRVARPGDFMFLDESTCANLDLVPFRGKPAATTLLGVLDVTRTAMGARKLRDWLMRPLTCLGRITTRHDAVEALVKDRVLLNELREALGGIRDLERLITRLSTQSGSARDLVALGQSLACLPTLRELTARHPVKLLCELGRKIETLPELADLINRAFVESPPLSTRDGGMIKDGFHHELDELRKFAREGKSWLIEYEKNEQQRTGIKNLKVRYNQVFGYYIEVSKGQLDKVPADYTRKQTLVGAERFVTSELKDYETRILGARERADALEYEIFSEIRTRAVEYLEQIQNAADAVAELDVLAALADRALALGYVRPRVTCSDRIWIQAGRHPVLERLPDAERFVPNDTVLDCGENRILIITGPNMAGKSTYIRQVALLVILAQMGSFVPADEAEIGLVDRVFTRVGASDDLTRGRSTFMVEMQETANILNNATRRSLIVLDEIGRGTSTFDGISIAWAVAEHLHNAQHLGARTLFATHYHELTGLARTLHGAKNYNVLVKEQGDRVVFLRRIVPGGSDKSYGIQVARLAGLPPEVVERAREILTNLEEGEAGGAGGPRLARRRGKKTEHAELQLPLFEQAKKSPDQSVQPQKDDDESAARRK